MSNASSCRAAASRYASLAEAAHDPEVRRAYRRLERLWLDMAIPAESFDARHDGAARERIFALIDAAEHVRQQVA